MQARGLSFNFFYFTVKSVSESNTYLLIIYCLPGTVTSSRNTAVSKIVNPWSCGTYALVKIDLFPWLWRTGKMDVLATIVSLFAQLVKNLSAVQKTPFDSWARKIPWRRDSILAWRIPMDRGAQWATVHGVAKNNTTGQLNTAWLSINICGMNKWMMKWMKHLRTKNCYVAET